MIEINRHIEILLLSNDCVIVPGFGGFMAHHVDARYDGTDNMFLPPLRTVGFNPQLTMNDSLLVLSYVETYDMSYPEALRRIEDEVAEIRQTLENEGKYEVDNVGILSLNEDGNIEFEPHEAGILTPDFYGLGGFDMMPVAQLTAGEEANANKAATSKTAAPTTESKPNANLVEMPAKPMQKEKEAAVNNSVFINDDEEEETSAEFISIRKSWLRNLAAACIAIIAFFTISTPLGAPTMQKSQIDTGMLNRIMPKEIDQMEKAKELVVNGDGTKLMETSENAAQNAGNTAQNANQDAELSLPSTYYSIVLASRVTKHNAANYAERLQGKGFKQARVLITENNVKVIYGTYNSESEAHAALKNLRDNEAFADGWITKVKE
ncbi:SPOR domain-containing protein [Segatella copri]|uniref:HU domain-containing protein n=1 Tax=Segatella copri TaxID=165179 RepID=UPI0034636198